MVVIISEESRDTVGVRKTATLIKRNSRRTVASADNQCMATSGTVSRHKINHHSAVSLIPEFRQNGKILQFGDSFTFQCNHTYCHSGTVNLSDKHIATVEIPVNHRLLLIGKQQNVEIVLFA